MRFYFKPTVTITCLVLSVCMVRLSIWQWHRHLQKQALIAEMEERLRQPPAPSTEVFGATDLKQPPDQLLHRRVIVSGTFDYDHEVVLRNRRYGPAAGVHVLTPMKLSGSELHVIVDRGFVPLTQSTQEKRAKYRGPLESSFTGLIKETSEPFWIAPQDPPAGAGHPWVDAWLRVDLTKMAAQLPYSIAPVYLEIMNTDDPKKAESEIVRSTGGREEMLFLGFKQDANSAGPDVDPSLHYPVPVFDTVIPPGRHLGYVYEWASMAVMTLLIGFVLQLRPGAKRDPQIAT